MKGGGERVGGWEWVGGGGSVCWGGGRELGGERWWGEGELGGVRGGERVGGGEGEKGVRVG